MTHQVTLQLCDGCRAEFESGGTVPLVRRSHRYSFWCEHAVTDDWYPGYAPPLGMRIGPL